MARNKQDNTAKYVAYGVGGVAVIAIAKTLLNKFSTGFSLLSAKSDAEKVKADLNPQSANATRYTFVIGVVDSLKKEFSAFNQSETNIVSLLNSLNNAEEVIYASTYFKTAEGKSLKAEVQDALDSGANPFGWFASSHWSSLNKYVQQNLV